ncbi:helix-turn-helix transcriptional regulator [Natronomonas halophila]|uniref:ArsR/SmtB family transcription factor n=1 Tax=Natronomonas halophila TaxID=2747817 RepID=UPI0015B640CA|nr:helix-turn-helix domain-containing protein [Natronomonas halophila]QLD85592.1 helix-turn-helix transcriptional regulator [Natronomonas halophila]
MSLLPSSPDISPDSEPRVVGLDSEEADDLMAALSSTTARRLLSELHDDPAPPGELADRVDTSLQNAQYHLEKLEDAGAIEVVGTAYSEKGREMNVYGPADSPLVIFAGEQERASGLRAALSRLFGGFLALGVGALAIQELFGRSLLRAGGEGAAPAGTETPTPEPSATGTPTSTEGGNGGNVGIQSTETEAAADTPAPTEAPEAAETMTPTEVATEAADGMDLPAVIDALGGGLPPGLAFFLGGATVLTVIVALTYVRTRP